MQIEDVSFFSGPGLKLSGRFYKPAAERSLGLSLLVCHGFGGTKDGTPVELAKSLAAKGVQVLTFDYRGFGESEGIPGRIVPCEQVEDAVQALAWLSVQAGVAAGKIGIYGNSFGGGIAIQAAAASGIPHAAIIAVPVMSGSDWLKSLMPAGEFAELKKRAWQAFTAKAVSGDITMVDRFDIMVPDPRTRANYDTPVPVALESMMHVLRHEPIADACMLEIPTAVYGITGDRLVPVAQTHRLFEGMKGPKELFLFESDNHFGFYQELLPDMTAGVISWLTKFLIKGGEK